MSVDLRPSLLTDALRELESDDALVQEAEETLHEMEEELCHSAEEGRRKAEKTRTWLDEIPEEQLSALVSAGPVRTESLLALLSKACPSSSIRGRVCIRLEEEGFLEPSWKTLDPQRQISGSIDDEEGSDQEKSENTGVQKESVSVVEAVDLLQLEVFNSSAIKNIGRFNCEFIRFDCVGRGGFGEAYRVQNLVDEKEYCIKELHLSAAKFNGSVTRMVSFARGVLREVSVLSSCEHHDNVVKYNNAWAELKTERKTHNTTTSDDEGEDEDEEEEEEEEEDEDEEDEGRRREGKSSPSRTEAKQGKGSARKGGGGVSQSSSGAFWSAEYSQDGSQSEDVTSSTRGRGEEERSRAGPEHAETLPSLAGRALEATGERKRALMAISQRDPEACSQADQLSNPGADQLSHPDQSQGGAMSTPEKARAIIVYALQVVVEEIQRDDEQLDKCVLSTINAMEAEVLRRDIVLYIQMELCHNRTLAHWLAESARKINVERNLQILLATLKGLTHIHKLGICHRDLKPGNLFISKDGVIKLGDFGLALPSASAAFTEAVATLLRDSEFKTRDPHTRGVGTALYAAPEQMAGHDCDTKADIFSFGIITIEIFSLFGSGMERIVVLSQAREGKLPAGFCTDHPELAALATECLQVDPRNRPTAAAVIEKLAGMFHQESLPPLLELADRTIWEMEALLKEKDAVLKTQAAALAIARQEAADKDKEIQQQQDLIDGLKLQIRQLEKLQAMPALQLPSAAGAPRCEKTLAKEEDT